MLPLLILPVLGVSAVAHRFLQLYAPSNVLVRRVRLLASSWPLVGALLLTSLVLAGMVQVLGLAIRGGAPGWLNLVVLVLAWDAIKIGVLGCTVAAKLAVSIVRPAPAEPRAKPDDGLAVIRCV